MVNPLRPVVNRDGSPLRSNERPMDAEPQRAVGTLPDDKPKDPAPARVIICQPNARASSAGRELVAA